MKSLKLTIKFKTSVGSELQSDTIFGQFAWEYRYLYGKDKLKNMLEDFQSNPFIVFSDGFVENSISMPLIKIPAPQELRDKLGSRYYEEMKKIKKASLIKVDNVWLDNPTFENVKEHVLKDVAVKEAVIMKNSINRISNTTKEGLYSVAEKFFYENIDIYVKYDQKRVCRKEIEEVFKSIGESGFGRDRSTGKGHFEVVKIEENPSILNRKGRYFISISSGLPDNDCKIYSGKTFTKFAKHGGDLVFGNPFKNPFILFRSGSIFEIECEKVKDVYGQALEVSGYRGHYQNAYMIPVFINLGDKNAEV